jgi:hypothetical protein
VSTGRYVRTGYGTSNSKSIGDVVFIYRGAPAITFYQLGDPAGLVRLVKAARKSNLTILETQKKAQNCRKGN